MAIKLSPIPAPKQFVSSIKKGTSAPTSFAISFSSSFVYPKFLSLFRPFKTVAALELPPPRPAPIGILFLTLHYTLDYSLILL